MNDPRPISSPEANTKSESGSLGIGLAWSLLLAIAVVAVLMPIGSETLLFIFLFIGVSQLVYILPLVFHYKRKGNTRTVQGLLIGAGIVFLLNASCFGLVMTSFSH